MFSDEMSKFLEPAALRSMPPQVKESLQAGATEGISRLQKNIKLETGYVKRYQQLLKDLQGTAPKTAAELHY